MAVQDEQCGETCLRDKASPGKLPLRRGSLNDISAPWEAVAFQDGTGSGCIGVAGRASLAQVCVVDAMGA